MNALDLLAIRVWLEEAVQEKGATVHGGGIGMGAADIEISIGGQRFEVTLRPLPNYSQ